MTDRELFTAFQRHRTDELFRQIVDRHLNLVYSVARRYLPEPHMAEDVGQDVFLTLYRKASQIDPAIPLAAWLYGAARLRSLEAARAAARRRMNETEAAMRHDARVEVDLTWPLVVGELDEAVSELAENDRQAVVLRYFGGKTHRDIGAELNVSEEAARKRVDRAVDALREKLVVRRVVVSTIALTAAMEAHAVQAAPVELSGAILSKMTAVAATSSTGTAHATASLVKMKIAAGLLVVAVAVPGSIIALCGFNPSSPTASAATIPSVPIASASQPVVTLESYRLGENELVRIVRNAPPSVRLEMWKQLQPPSARNGQRRAPGIFAFDWNGGNPQDPIALGDVQRSTMDIVCLLAAATMGIQSWELETGANLPDINYSVPGDVVYTSTMPPDRAAALLEDALQRELQVQVKLSLRNVQRKVFVLRGKWHFTRINFKETKSPPSIGGKTVDPLVELFGGDVFDPHDHDGGGGLTSVSDKLPTFIANGTMSSYLARQTSEWIGHEVIIEASGLPVTIGWRGHIPRVATAESDRQAREPQAVLKHLCEQTGLTWTEETRTVRRLIIEPPL